MDLAACFEREEVVAGENPGWDGGKEGRRGEEGDTQGCVAWSLPQLQMTGEGVSAK